MALRSTQLLTKMSTRNLPGGKKRPARRADNLATICKQNVLPQPLATLRVSAACMGMTLPLHTILLGKQRRQDGKSEPRLGDNTKANKNQIIKLLK
jgi:hypothetical protein